MRWWASRSRALALVLLTAASVGVFASPLVRASNSIGQDLGVWQGEEYRLILGEERRTLYQGERLLFTEERSSEGARIVVRRQDDDGQDGVARGDADRIRVPHPILVTQAEELGDRLFFGHIVPLLEDVDTIIKFF